MRNGKKILQMAASASLLAFLLPLQAWARVVLLHTNDIPIYYFLKKLITYNRPIKMC